MDEFTALSAPDDRKNTIATQLVLQIREQILAGDIQPGSKINIERLRVKLSVSLSPLREALMRLVSDGLVELEDNRGFRVPPLTLVNLAEITMLRVEFETIALQQAIGNGDIEWEGKVIQTLYLLNRAKREAAKPKTLENWEAAHLEFHLGLLSGCKMPMLLRSCRTLHNLNDRYRRILLRNTGGDRNVQNEHTVIAEAAVARKADEACKALRNHIQRTGTNLHRHLQCKLGGAN